MGEMKGLFGPVPTPIRDLTPHARCNCPEVLALRGVVASCSRPDPSNRMGDAIAIDE